MKVILFGATGMVGLGALRECLVDPSVTSVLTVGRAGTGQRHDKLREIVRADMFDLSPVAAELSGYDACFFCLGVSSVGMSEADYRRITYDLALSAARTLVDRNPGMTFVFVSGAGTDRSGRAMWARVKGETEDAILALPFKAAYMLRPGFIQPLHGVTSRARITRVGYAIFGVLSPVIKALFRDHTLTTESLGRAMLVLAGRGADKRVLEARDINAVLRSTG